MIQGRADDTAPDTSTETTLTGGLPPQLPKKQKGHPGYIGGIYQAQYIKEYRLYTGIKVIRHIGQG